MRLWSLHPKYLDRQGLLALWREALLAQKVLQNRTRGYKNHPQLERFKKSGEPVAAIAAYLRAVHSEAAHRGYAFDRTKIVRAKPAQRIRCTRGQILHEFDHLKSKLRRRDRPRLHEIEAVQKPRAHPMFRLVRGGVEPWERG